MIYPILIAIGFFAAGWLAAYVRCSADLRGKDEHQLPTQDYRVAE